MFHVEHYLALDSQLFHVKHLAPHENSLIHSRCIPGGFSWRELLPSPTKRAALERRRQPLISVPLSRLPRSTPSSLTPTRRVTPPARLVSPRIPPAARSIKR